MKKAQADGIDQFVKMPRGLPKLLSAAGINTIRLTLFLLEEDMRQAGKKNGYLVAPRRQLTAFGIGARHISGAIDEAARLGLIDCIRGTGRAPNHFALTWRPVAGEPPTHRWRAQAKENSQ